MRAASRPLWLPWGCRSLAYKLIFKKLLISSLFWEFRFLIVAGRISRGLALGHSYYTPSCNPWLAVGASIFSLQYLAGLHGALPLFSIWSNARMECETVRETAVLPWVTALLYPGGSLGQYGIFLFLELQELGLTINAEWPLQIMWNAFKGFLWRPSEGFQRPLRDL